MEESLNKSNKSMGIRKVGPSIGAIKQRTSLKEQMRDFGRGNIAAYKKTCNTGDGVVTSFPQNTIKKQTAFLSEAQEGQDLFDSLMQQMQKGLLSFNNITLDQRDILTLDQLNQLHEVEKQRFLQMQRSA